MPELLDLPSVTMMCADSIEAGRAIVVLERCKKLCRFGDVKFFTHIDTNYEHQVLINKLATLSDYSAFMLKKAHEYITTSHVLTVQHDGWVMNPDTWNPAWMQYDYIGPLFLQEHQVNNDSVGSGGFSFRSKALMAFVSASQPHWDGSSGSEHWTHEDGEICKCLRGPLTANGFKFAPPHEAAKFAQGGNPVPEYYVEKPFGFHGLWPNIDRKTGLVAPWPWP